MKGSSGNKAAKAGYLRLPKGWSQVAATGPGPFITRRVLERPDKSRLVWISRRHRKLYNFLSRHPASVWWAPTAIGWWLGVLFSIGGTAFALGATPAYVNAVGTDNSNLTFFVGSIFFTSAAFLQYLEMAAVMRTPEGAIPNLTRDRQWRLFSWEPQRIDWWIATSQLLGTLLFNISTFNALSTGLDAVQTDKLVWTPDLYGSICFLVAGGLAWFEVSHNWLSWKFRELSWWIAALNLLGSIAFGISAIASYGLPGGRELDPAVVNLGTLAGGLCFLGGATLLLPERVQLMNPALEAL